MSNLKTKIVWNLHDYCSYQCDYCPIKLRGGAEFPEIKEYIKVANIIIQSYSNLGRTIEWEFNGGEPLDMHDIVSLLKLCKQTGESVTLHTNGGKLWMDWWAIEPYVDVLNLTYHYWQNVSLIDYIIQTFKKNNKQFSVSVPMRPDYFDQDLERALDIEQRHNIVVGKTVLYKEADRSGGMFNYTKEQAAIMSGVKIIKDVMTDQTITPKQEIENSQLVKEQQYFKETTWHDRYQERMSSNPSYTGKLCNMGIEFLSISHQGWVSGAHCNNTPLGNIWHGSWQPPTGPQTCGMRVCENQSDQKITKFLD